MANLKFRFLFAGDRPASLATHKENVQRQSESEEKFKFVSIVLQLWTFGKVFHWEDAWSLEQTPQESGHSPNPARVQEMSEWWS